VQLFDTVRYEVAPIAPATFDESIVNVHQVSPSSSTADQYGTVKFLYCFRYILAKDAMPPSFG